MSDSQRPFIASQRLFHLQVGGERALDWLAQARFTARRRFVDKSEQETIEFDPIDPETPATPKPRELSADEWQAGLKWDLDEHRLAELGNPAAGWDEIQHREQFWLDKNRPYICVVDNAGLGKTEVLDQAAYLRSVDWPGHLVVRFDFARLMKDLETPLLGVEIDDQETPRQWPLLVDAFWGAPSREVVSTADRWQTWRLLSRSAKTGRLTLVVDSLDQVQGTADAAATTQRIADAASRLADFLKAYSEVRCIVSGRPFAVQTHLDTLFRGRHWDFVQLDCFDEPQCEQYFRSLWEHVRRIESVGGLVPRDLAALWQLDATELRGLRTQADIYTTCHQKSFEQGRKNQPTDLRSNLVVPLLCLLAFEMRQAGITDGLGDERGDSQPAQERLDRFVMEVRQRHEGFLRGKQIASVGDLTQAIGHLNALNLAMDPGMLNIPLVSNPLERPLVWLRFRNRTLQDYFAARWLTHYTTAPAEVDWLHQHRPVRRSSVDFAEHGDFEELWRFVAEMPSKAADDVRWLRTVAPLFEELPAERTTAVCSELIFRAWPRLMSLAGPPPDQPIGSGNVSSEETPWCERHTHGWQKHVAAAIKEGTFPPGRPPENAPAKEWAGHLLRQFLGTFPRLAFRNTDLVRRFLGIFLRLALRHTQGSERKGGANQAFGGTRDAAEVARESWEGFIKIPAGQHWMGQPKGPKDEPDHIATFSGRTSLSRYPLTNEAYALFSPRHRERFSDYARYSPSARCPAIYLTWFDAWCVATWMHARLPNEYEWEAACRAQFWQPGEAPPQHQTYWFGDAEEKLKLHAWYFDNSRFKTHPIGAEGHANALGFSDMLGQVWEWTGSPYAMHPKESKGSASAMIVSRVLRGGAFYVNAVYCRSAYRGLGPPVLTDLCGVRLARAEYL